MKTHVSIFALVACLGISLTARASDITETLSNGVFSPSGSFSGSFLINSSTEILDGGMITATAPGGGTTYTFSKIGSDSSTPGFESFTDSSGDTFDLALNGGLNSLAINTLAGNGASADTHLITAAGVHFDATSATVAAAPTPEPSSLLLLGTAALGLAGAFRRRFLNT